MSRRSGPAAPARALRLVVLLVVAACSTHAKAPETRGPYLSIVERSGPVIARSAVGSRAVALALGGLPPEALPLLREHIAESTDAAMRRAAPELFDVGGLADDDGASDASRPALPDLPALTAAANVLGSPWNAPGISVELVPACGAASRCIPLFGPAGEPGNAQGRRGRSLAWALGNAALLRVSASSRPTLLRSLREAQRRPSGTVAMVFDATRGALDEAELELLRQEARQALRHLAPDAPQRPWLEALCAARADWELPITLDAAQLLVVPRLSALARLREFASEIERTGAFEWVVRPAPWLG